MRRRIASLLSDAEGATIVEFALILPVLMVTLMGLFDLSYNMYTSQMLQGAIQNAARSSTIEGASGDKAGIDGIVTRAVHAISPAATLQFDRRAYSPRVHQGGLLCAPDRACWDAAMDALQLS